MVASFSGSCGIERDGEIRMSIFSPASLRFYRMQSLQVGPSFNRSFDRPVKLLQTTASGKHGHTAICKRAILFRPSGSRSLGP